MDLLLRRGQTRGFRRVKFKLWAKAVLDIDEQKVMYRYGFDQSVVVTVDQPLLWLTATLVGAFATLVLTALIWNLAKVQWIGFLGIPLGIAAGFLFFDRKREYLLMRDLIHGRYFTCKSIVRLAQEEARIKHIASVVRQVMETAKLWDDTEVIPIEPLSPEEAKHVALKSLF
jgi:hypothetical protein